MSKIYVIIGAEGQWSDHHEWICAAYTDADKAKTHAKLATAFADAWYALDSDTRIARCDKNANGSTIAFASPYDPEGLDAWNYADKTYYTTEVELLEDVP